MCLLSLSKFKIFELCPVLSQTDVMLNECADIAVKEVIHTSYFMKRDSSFEFLPSHSFPQFASVGRVIGLALLVRSCTSLKVT